MLRKTDLLLLSFVAVAGVALFHTSYQVQGLREELSNLDRQIASENDGIQVLKAEWSFLNDPARLEQLASSHLTLKPITATQIAGFEALPMRAAGATIPVSTQPGAPAAAPTQARKAAPLSPQDKAAQGVRQSPSPGATLASVQVPAAPQQHRSIRPHPVPVPTLAVTHASVRSGGTGSLSTKDDIGSLLNRLGRIQ